MRRSSDAWIAEVLTSETVRGKIVLDMACGQGFEIATVSRSARWVFGVDVAFRPLRRAAAAFRDRGIGNAVVVAADGEALPFRDVFDVAYCIGGLNHNADPRRAAEQLYAALKPGGLAVVMVYRRYTPLWALVALARLIARGLDRLLGEANWVARRLERYYVRHPVPSHGTALLELFGCPILRTYTRRSAKALFTAFTIQRTRTYRSGLDQIIRFLPRALQWPTLHRWLTSLDRLVRGACGFYLVVECQKPATHR